MLSVKKTHQNTTNQNSVCFLTSKESLWHSKTLFILFWSHLMRTKAHTYWCCVMMVVVGPYVCGQRGMALLVKVCEWMWLPCRACSAVVLISLWQCSCWCCWPRTLWRALVLLHCPPFSPTIPQSLGLHQPSLRQAPKSPVSSCRTLRALTLTCLCSFSHLSPCPSSSILTAQLLTSPLLSLYLTDLSSEPPLREDSLPDSTCVSNIISSCNWIWWRGIFSQNWSDLA